MRRFVALLILGYSWICGLCAEPQPGYRGFVEWTNSLTSLSQYSYSVSYENNTFETIRHPQKCCYFTGLSTSHGYQFNKTFFLGAGFEIAKNTTGEAHINAMFVEGRSDLRFGKFTPFADMRLGFDAGTGNFVGPYFSPSIGYRQWLHRKLALNAGLGFTIAKTDETMRSASIVYSENHEWYILVSEKIGYKRFTKIYFTFRVGIEF